MREAREEMREHFRIKETSVWITADEKKHIEVAKDELVRQRRELVACDYERRNGIGRNLTLLQEFVNAARSCRRTPKNKEQNCENAQILKLSNTPFEASPQ